MQEVTISKISGGVCWTDLPYKIADNQGQDMLNMWFNDKVLNKRWGQTLALTNLAGVVYNIYPTTFFSYGVFHAGNSFYKWDITNSTTTVITNTVANTQGSFFRSNDNLYYMDGTKYWTINSNFVAAEVTAYVPTVLTGATPTLSASTTYEAYNMIGSGFKVWYTADGTNAYSLPQTNLSNTAVTATIGSTNYAETTDFIVDRTNGIVTFTNAPPNTGILNDVRITAYKDDATNKAKIMACTLAIPFGGDSAGVYGGTRVFVAGNTNYPTTYWRSGLQDPTYFPDTEYDILDATPDSIVAFGKQYGELIVLKERSIYAIRYNFNPEYSASGIVKGGTVIYPTRLVHDTIGCDMRGSVQLVDNRLVFFNTYKFGFILDATDKDAENNVKPISENIRGTTTYGLQSQTIANMKLCSSFDFGRKYFLNIDNDCYVWDYDISPYYDEGDYSAAQKRLAWFPWSTIYGKSWFSHENTLYYGMSSQFSMTKFVDDFDDYDAAISCYWHSKAFDFTLPNYLKTVQEVFMNLRTDTNTSVTIEYYDERNSKIDSKTIMVGNFVWDPYNRFNWDVFTWDFRRYATAIRRRPKRKKIVYFSIKLSNATTGRDLGVTDIVMRYVVNRRVK